jgi:hypothetical protein
LASAGSALIYVPVKAPAYYDSDDAESDDALFTRRKQGIPSLALCQFLPEPVAAVILP